MTTLPLRLGASLPGSALPPARLPGLRQEVDILEGPRARSVAPTWTLHDPVRNTYFRLGWVEVEILARCIELVGIALFLLEIGWFVACIFAIDASDLLGHRYIC